LKSIRIVCAGVACACGLAFAGVPADAGQTASPWVGSWGASPSDPLAGVTPPTPSFKDQTVRMMAHLSLGGSALRLRLSNALGNAPLTIGEVHVAQWKDGAIVAGTDHIVTFGGAPDAVIPKHALLLSDPVALAVPTLSDVAISIYFPTDTGPISEHSLAVQTSYVTQGNAAAQASWSNAATLAERPVLSAVEVEHPAAAAVVTLGDSITDGQHSTVDALARYPDALARRLASAGLPIGVVNAGINGNRLLSESHFGPNALSRFDSDVLTQAGVRSVIVLLGINDIGHVPDTPATAAQIMTALRQLAERGHERGLRMIGATLLPFENSPYWSDSGESMRQAVNAFVRSSGAFDAVVDFDAAMRDPARPVRLRSEFDSGDHLHPNDRGYQAMAHAVDLKQLAH
jgi:lysophospholipase L1-like esterase